MWEVEKELDYMLDDKSDYEWKVVSESNKKGEELKYETTQSKRGMIALRVVTRSDHDSLLTARAYLDKKTKMTFDKNIKDCECLKILGANLFEGWQITNALIGV